ncbi:MAG: hypothetical protein R2882_04800 [Gemmatimonadales bacterium]
MIIAEDLPTVATNLVARGVETPALIELAGLIIARPEADSILARAASEVEACPRCRAEAL